MNGRFLRTPVSLISTKIETSPVTKLNHNGSILILMTLGFVILGFFVGMAVDLGRGYLLKARLSRLVDGAALAAAKILKGGAFQNEATRAACDSLLMNGLQVEMSDSTTCSAVADSAFKLTIDFVDKPVPGGAAVKFVQVRGSNQVSTTFLRLLALVGPGDFSKLHVTAFAEAGPERPVDLMLVLDRSGSMVGTDGVGTTKFAAMKTTVNEFLAQNFSPLDRIGMTSFGYRGCGNSGGTNFTGVSCLNNEDKPLGSSISSIEAAINNLQLSGGTNTMEGLLTARGAMVDALNDPTRESSRKVVLLVTDGQPTIIKRSSESECKKSPISGSPLPSPGDNGSFPSGCLFEKGGDSVNSQSHYLLRRPLDVNPSLRIPVAPSLDYTLYQNVISSARSAALTEANRIRNLGEKNVVIFVIAIGEPTNQDSTARLDANARCLLARTANDPNTLLSGTPGPQSGSCESVYTTPDGDTHADLKQNWPCGFGPCIDETQLKGKVFTVDLSGDVRAQLKAIFNEIAILLKLRLTV